MADFGHLRITPMAFLNTKDSNTLGLPLTLVPGGIVFLFTSVKGNSKLETRNHVFGCQGLVFDVSFPKGNPARVCRFHFDGML